MKMNAATAAAKSLQLRPTLCNPIDGSPPGSPVPGILQARTLELVAISFSNAWKWKVKVRSLSRVRLLATPWTAAHQAPPSMGFSRQEYWCGCHCLLRWKWIHVYKCTYAYTHIYIHLNCIPISKSSVCITNSNFAFAAVLRNLRYMTKIFISRFIWKNTGELLGSYGIKPKGA